MSKADRAERRKLRLKFKNVSAEDKLIRKLDRSAREGFRGTGVSMRPKVDYRMPFYLTIYSVCWIPIVVLSGGSLASMLGGWVGMCTVATVTGVADRRKTRAGYRAAVEKYNREEPSRKLHSSVGFKITRRPLAGTKAFDENPRMGYGEVVLPWSVDEILHSDDYEGVQTLTRGGFGGSSAVDVAMALSSDLPIHTTDSFAWALRDVELCEKATAANVTEAGYAKLSKYSILYGPTRTGRKTVVGTTVPVTASPSFATGGIVKFGGMHL